ncbi:helix-turn-helix domain-containing protein [Cellulomonas chengniuliangii]|uniref:helix-turn-helix domain-containing protein n=1 Tax=Cellulomonas chengniuliangii TaxID=2968084 RepID=UPI001D0DC664|nr:helix-turn-helix transcriptional regulator [Cellulomonas chengniuliangii]MCC2317365.1 helix-turn-helix transcriptional regulator [Cellulomonas chengniuliangii]
MKDENVTSQQGELAAMLRAWRDRAHPADLGLPTRSARRVPGIRREELAALANLSVDYIVRLEQGRSENPSPQVVAALGRALRLSRDELGHLYLLAGLLPPGRLSVSRHVSPGIQRMLTQLGGTPLAVYDATWTMLSRNQLWVGLQGEATSEPGQNLLRQTFLDGHRHTLQGEQQIARFRRALAADLRTAAGRYPQDREIQSLIGELLGASVDFATLWADGVVETFRTERKTVLSPLVGVMTLDCDVLTTTDDDLRIVIYTAAASSPESERLRDLALFAAT